MSNDEYVKNEWIVEHSWDCRHCWYENKGSSDKCENCGKPIDDKHKENIPSDMSKNNAVKDAEKIKRFSSGPDWVCKYCSHRNQNAHQTCVECGSNKSENKAVIPSGAPSVPNTRAPSKTYKPEKDSDDLGGHSIPPGPYREPITSPKLNIGGIPKKQYFRWTLYVLVPVFIVMILVWLFSWHETTATVTENRWTMTVELKERRISHGTAWRDGVPAYSFNEQCRTEIRSYHNCNAYQCNPHRVSYDCNCRTYQTCSPREVCRTSCTNSGNRSSRCREICRTVNNCSSRISCSTCYRTEYNTCYQRCPDYDQRCEFDYPSWPVVRTATNSQANHLISPPNVGSQSGTRRCPSSNPETLYRATGATQCVQETQTFSVLFESPNHGTYSINPTTFSEYNLYNVGQVWNAEYTMAGNFRVLYRKQ